MFSSRRKPVFSTPGAYVSSSSEDLYRPGSRPSSPVPLRQLIAGDLNRGNVTGYNPSPYRQREPFRIPRPTITVPPAAVLVPNNRPVWAPDAWLTHERELPRQLSPSGKRFLSPRLLYQRSPRPTSFPVLYQIIPAPLRRSTPFTAFRRSKHKRYVQERTPGLCATLCSGGLASFAVLAYLALLLSLPTIKLVLGILYLKECPVNTSIPLYMIISGAAGLAIILFLLVSSTCAFCRSSIRARPFTHKFMIFTIAFARGTQGLLAIFLFIWFFFGNVWVFGVRSRVQTNNASDIQTYCQPLLYWVAFYVLIFTYIFAFFMFFMKLCVNFCFCRACDVWKKAFS